VFDNIRRMKFSNRTRNSRERKPRRGSRAWVAPLQITHYLASCPHTSSTSTRLRTCTAPKASGVCVCERVTACDCALGVNRRADGDLGFRVQGLGDGLGIVRRYAAVGSGSPRRAFTAFRNLQNMLKWSGFASRVCWGEASAQ